MITREHIRASLRDGSTHPCTVCEVGFGTETRDCPVCGRTARKVAR